MVWHPLGCNAPISINQVLRGEGTVSQVFISYSRRDLDFVQHLSDRIRRRNFRVWMDKSDIKPGSNWQEAIKTSVCASDAMIAVISPDSVTSEWVRIEIDEALDQNIPVIPYVYRATELPLRLKKVNAIFHNEGEDVAFEKLIAALPEITRLHASAVIEQGLLGRRDVTFSQAAEGIRGVLRPYLMVGDQRVDLVGLPLRPTRYCMTYLVGQAGDTLEWHSPVQLGLQLAQPYPGDHFLAEIAAHFFTSDTLDFKLRLLLVRGPMQINYYREQYQAAYGLDPDAPDEWQDVLNAVQVGLEAYTQGTRRPDLQVFMLGPGVILYRLGERHREYVRSELYQRVPARKEYMRVL